MNIIDKEQVYRDMRKRIKLLYKSISVASVLIAIFTVIMIIELITKNRE